MTNPPAFLQRLAVLVPKLQLVILQNLPAPNTKPRPWWCRKASLRKHRRQPWLTPGVPAADWLPQLRDTAQQWLDPRP